MMSFFYRATAKELLELRNKVFLEKGITSLEKVGFKKTPFSTARYGRNNLNDFMYEFYRIDNAKSLILVDIHICRGDKYVQIYLNIFDLHPNPLSLDNLNGLYGLEFYMYPNSNTKMRLRVDDSQGIPVLNFDLFKQHKIRTYFTKSGLKQESERLGNLIERDFLNIDLSIKRWHELHTPLITDWEGNPLKNVKDLNFTQKVLFACILSSRLIKNYNVFSLKFGFGSTQVLTSIIDKVVNSISELGQISPEEIDKMIVEIDKITPDTEDFDSVLVSLAVDACVSVVSILQFLKDKNVKWIEDIKTCTFDSVDNFIQESLDLDFNDNEFESKIANNELMIKERLFQQNLINEIIKHNTNFNFSFYSKDSIFDINQLK